MTLDSACRKHQPPGSEDKGAFDRFRSVNVNLLNSLDFLNRVRKGKVALVSMVIGRSWIALLDQEPYFNYFWNTGRATHG